MITASLSNTEIVIDSFIPQFRRIAQFARHVLREDQELRKSDGPRLQYGMGLVMALFYTAIRCRDFCMRREAISILQEWPCTNGIWHSLRAAKVAEWVAKIGALSGAFQEELKDAVRRQLQFIAADLDTLRNENMILDSERNPEFRVGLATEVDRAREDMKSVKGTINELLNCAGEDVMLEE